MKNKKYNTSLKELYEGFARLKDRAFYQNPQGRNCKINVPDNVRQFLFSVGEYASKNNKGEEADSHTRIVGFLSSKLPLSIFRSIEKAIANKQNFDMIMSGPVADFAGLFLTQIDCNIIQLGLNKLSEFLNKTTSFKSSTKGLRDQIDNQEAALRQNPESSGIMSSIFGGAAVGATSLPADKSANLRINFDVEEARRTEEIVRNLRIDKINFVNIFRSLETTTDKIDLNVFYFENFFKEYYDNRAWDLNKLQEDLDEIVDIAKKCNRASNERHALVTIYQNFMNIIGAKPNPSNESILNQQEKNFNAADKKLFIEKLGMIIFLGSPRDGNNFFGKPYNLLINNTKIINQLPREYKNMLQRYYDDIIRIFIQS